MRLNFRRSTTTALGLVLASLGAYQAQAAEPAEDKGIGEVVVTAEFRRADLQKTPIAITVVKPEVLELRAVENLRDVVTRIPGLAAPTALQHSQTSYYIRGIGESDSIANQTVGLYVDDVYIPRPIGGTFELNDIQDIQVLRGPQGTLYGRNSSAGAIKVTTRLPDDQFKSFFEVGGGNYEAGIIRAGLSTPIIEGKLAGGVSYVHRQRDGLVYNVTNNRRVGKIETDATRVKLNFTPTDKLSFLFAADYFEDNGDPTPKQSRIQPGGVLDKTVNYSEWNISNNTQLGGASVRTTYQINDKSSFRSITSWRAFKQPGFYDQDGSAVAINRTYSNHRNEDWSQELQYLYDGEKLDLVAGLFYLYDNFRSYRTSYAPTAANALLPFRTTLLPARTTLQDSAEKTQNYSAYGQATYEVLPGVRLIGGARYTEEKHNFRFTGDEQNASGQYLPIFYTINRDYKKWDSFTPKVGADWQVAPNFLTYVTWSKGFKAGGFDGRATSKKAAGLPYDPEVVTALEAGVKAEFFDHALRTNLAVYSNEIKGYQATALDELGLSHRINLGKVKTDGFELETTWQPFSSFSLNYNVAYMDSKVKSAGGAVTNAALYVGKRAQNSPEWQNFVSADYVLPFHLAGEYRVGAEHVQRSKTYIDGINTETAVAEPYEVYNLAASFEPENAKNWRFSLAVKNIFDKQFDTGGLRGNGVTTANATTYSDPRTWFLRARYAY